MLFAALCLPIGWGLRTLLTLALSLGEVGSALAWGTGMSRLGFLTTHGFSALALQDCKGFLRFRISADGALHGAFIAIDRVPRVWGMSETPQPVLAPTDRSLTSRVHDQFVIRK